MECTLQRAKIDQCCLAQAETSPILTHHLANPKPQLLNIIERTPTNSPSLSMLQLNENSWDSVCVCGVSHTSHNSYGLLKIHSGVEFGQKGD